MEYRLQEVNFSHEELMRLNESQKITLRNYYFDQLIHGTILSEEEAAYAQNYLPFPIMPIPLLYYTVMSTWTLWS